MLPAERIEAFVIPLTSRRAGMVRTICDAAAHLCVSNLAKNAVPRDGHAFVKTTFDIRTSHGTFPVYYCECGELALLENDTSHGLVALTDDGQEHDLSGCRLASAHPAARTH